MAILANKGDKLSILWFVQSCPSLSNDKSIPHDSSTFLVVLTKIGDSKIIKSHVCLKIKCKQLESTFLYLTSVAKTQGFLLSI
ncbi:MAG: hypothetical protein MJ233_02015 [Mycoplasmoidaceae bacterium]|nr:hypothetical protein [Mycoplasmoidaceae bacterium]